MQHEITADELLDQPHVARAFKKIKALYPFVEERHFQSAVLSFFSDPDPTFAALKWNLAQNYFVAKCLGLDSSGRLLSREVFGDADIYLDTNVVIEAIEPSAKHHPSFEVLAKACSDLGMKLHVCQISIDELRKVVSYERETIEKVADKIPDETAPKIKGVLFPVYYRQRQSGQNPTFDELFEYFSEPSTTPKTFYEVEIVDDRWFIENLDAAETESLARQIKETYETRPGKHKSKNAADHDSLLLRWVRRERESGQANAWIVTLDHSLPNFRSPSKQGEIPLAIRLDTLLHWLAPIALQADEGQDRAAVIFSEALKYNLLPQENFFEIGDFLAFAEWEWDTKQLPAEDIEGCIRCVKTALPHLNPAEPSDRERISREFNKFLRDPGRKYQGELARLEAKNAELIRERNEADKLRADTATDLGVRLSKKEAELAELRGAAQKRELRASAFRRLAPIGALGLLTELTIGYFAIHFGSGENYFQKLKEAWDFLVIPMPIAAGVSWFVLGRDRFEALGWPFTKLLSGSKE